MRSLVIVNNDPHNLKKIKSFLGEECHIKDGKELVDVLFSKFEVIHTINGNINNVVKMIHVLDDNDIGFKIGRK